MAKTQATEQPKQSGGAKADPDSHQPAGGPPQDDRQETETAAARHEGTTPPQHKAE